MAVAETTELNPTGRSRRGEWWKLALPPVAVFLVVLALWQAQHIV